MLNVIRHLAVLAAKSARDEALRRYYADTTDLVSVYALARATVRLYRAELAASEVV